MMENLNLLSNNQIMLEGTILEGLEYSHEMYKEKFYSFHIGVRRLSETVDNILVLVSERLIFNMTLSIGTEVSITGQLRSYNKFIDGANRLILTVFAKDIKIDFEKSINPNQIFLDGYICKPPTYRKTPFGKEITDILIAVNRSYNKSDYIPVIVWGRNARYSSELMVGDNIKVQGRVQSREYIKKVSNGEPIAKTAFEVSASFMEKVEKEIEIQIAQ